MENQAEPEGERILRFSILLCVGGREGVVKAQKNPGLLAPWSRFVQVPCKQKSGSVHRECQKLPRRPVAWVIETVSCLQSLGKSVVTRPVQMWQNDAQPYPGPVGSVVLETQKVLNIKSRCKFVTVLHLHFWIWLPPVFPCDANLTEEVCGSLVAWFQLQDKKNSTYDSSHI